ncbi:HIT finger domain protein [Aspergillus cavernicola]|uniref:HIT finger domain protein n=1 Tax=Aspergillus cavernicola TaxID=176166 RepID=A0ABR4I6D1_9EURO
MSEEESLLTNLCTICHIQPPKYRCPRCSTRTCSLPCTRRHKLWSQCTGIRDPAAYLRRSDLATESAFDRDFNFITGIERRLERADREAENRGVQTDVRVNRVRDAAAVGLEHEDVVVNDGGGKRKRGAGMGQGLVSGGNEGGFVKGEMGFLKRAKGAGVRVVQAPRGMSRAKLNGSKWHQKQKCLQWTVEWVEEDGKKRMNSVETSTIAEAYDRAFPLSREEKELKRARYQMSIQENGQALETTLEAGLSETEPQSTVSEPSNGQSTAQQDCPPSEKDTTPHRNVYFYLHRPRTTAKLPVLSPVAAATTLTNALRGRVVLEFPTIYVLRDPLDEQGSEEESKFILEKDYLRTHQDTEPEVEEASNTDTGPPFSTVEIPDVDEEKVLEVLQKDLLGTAPAGTSQII